MWYGKELVEDIEKGRAAHGKRPLKDLGTAEDDEDDPEPPKSSMTGKANPNTSRKNQARKKIKAYNLQKLQLSSEPHSLKTAQFETQFDQTL